MRAGVRHLLRVKTSHRFNPREAPWSAVAAATALDTVASTTTSKSRADPIHGKAAASRPHSKTPAAITASATLRASPPWSAVAAATALESRSVNHHSKSRADLIMGSGSFAAALQALRALSLHDVPIPPSHLYDFRWALIFHPRQSAFGTRAAPQWV